MSDTCGSTEKFVSRCFVDGEGNKQLSSRDSNKRRRADRKTDVIITNCENRPVVPRGSIKENKLIETKITL